MPAGTFPAIIAAMAAVDSLLKVASARGAEAIIITSDEVPAIRRGGAPEPLSMPPIGGPLVRTFLAEVVGDRELADGGFLTTSYLAADGLRYSVRIEDLGDKLRLAFTQTGSATQTAPARAAPKRVAPPSRAETPTAPFSRVSADEPAAAPQPADPIEPGATSADAVATLHRLCEYADQQDAADLFLSGGADARIRVVGELRELPGTAMADDELLAAFTLDRPELATLATDRSLDFAIEPRPGSRYRVNLYHHADGLAAALRPIRSVIPTLEQLNLPGELRDLADYPNGLVLVTGMAGSGKSTTLASIVDHVNRSRSRHVITLEDPIEYRYPGRQALIHQREIGVHVTDFASGLRAALRESPDLILLGEMRDRETIAAALTAAETGHLVLATLHASNAMVAIDRIIDVFPSDHQRQIRIQLSIVLREILTQYLLPTSAGDGRVPAYERMIKNDAIAANIRDDKTHQIPSAIQTGRAEGMVPLELSLARLVRQGHLTRAAALAVAKEQTYLLELLRG